VDRQHPYHVYIASPDCDNIFYDSMLIYELYLVANILTYFISHSVPYNPQKNMQTAWYNPLAFKED
jgi:hypothetical protein